MKTVLENQKGSTLDPPNAIRVSVFDPCDLKEKCAGEFPMPTRGKARLGHIYPFSRQNNQLWALP